MSKLNKYGFFNNCKTKYKNEKGEVKVYEWYNCWVNMILRCYDPSNKSYRFYGAKGITVDDYFRDAYNFKLFYEKHNPNHDLVMDKDLKGGITYSPHTITFVTNEFNSMEMQSRQKELEYPNYKRNDIGHYETTSSFRFNFKILCKKRGLKFDDFIEVFCDRVCCSNGKLRNRYYYFYIK